MVGAGVDATYDYGPENRRFRKTVNASVTSYAYDGPSTPPAASLRTG